MSEFNAAGYQPRIDPMGEQRLIEWLRAQVTSGQLDESNPHYRSPMFEHSTTAYSITWEMTVWNYVNMSVAAVPSQGYIQLLRSTNESGVTNNTWYAIRCLPTTEGDYYLWKHGTNCPHPADRLSQRDLQMHLGYNRQYNVTLGQRIRNYDSCQRGLCDLHSRIVSDMAALGRNLIAIACFQLAINVGSSSAMNPVPIAGELAGRAHAGR